MGITQAEHSQDYTIRHLFEVPHALPVLASWFVDEWEPYYGANGPGDAESDLKAASSANTLPLCLVAMDEHDAPAGTASLRAESVPSHRHLTPWVTAALVPPHCRSRGIYTRLLAAIEQEARHLKFSRLYLATDVALTLLARRGWREIDSANTLRQPVSVFELEL